MSNDDRGIFYKPARPGKEGNKGFKSKVIALVHTLQLPVPAKKSLVPGIHLNIVQAMHISRCYRLTSDNSGYGAKSFEEHKQLGWDIRRNLAKINYRIHTDAIKENLIPAELTRQQINTLYASKSRCTQHGIIRYHRDGVA
jgi:hypothetical protein